MPKSLFDHIKAICQEQDPNYWSKLTDADKRTWSTYMVNRFLSMNEEWVDIVNDIQLLTQTMTPEVVYKLYINVIPKGRRWLKYIKSTKNKKYEEWLIELMVKHFETSQKQAIDYLNILYSTDNGRIAIKEIAESYGTNTKKIKKLKL